MSPSAGPRPPLDPEPARSWLDRHAAEMLVLPHGDPDGLAAGALLLRHHPAAAAFLEPFEHAPAPATRPLAIVDQGVRRVPGDGPRLFVDHHADPEADAGTVFWDGDAPATALLAWQLVGRPAPEAWLAGLGILGDLGEAGLRSSELHGTVGPVAPLKRLTTLLSAAGRLRDGPLDTALTLLRAADGAAAALDDPRVAELDRARAEVDRLRKDAARTAPRVGPAAALIELAVPARVHAQVAIAWTRRLAPRPVVVSNRSWRPGKVSFAVRCAAPVDLRAWLRAIHTPAPGAGDYARGHARATGGSLLPDAYAEFVEALLSTTIAPTPL